jgi:hypothetical protein
MKTPLLIGAAITAAIGYVVPASAQPSYPVPFMQHDGTYLVGKDIRPGLYVTRGAAGGGMCSWSRHSSIGSGGVSNIIERSDSSDAQYALIAPTDAAFDTHGCQPWAIGTRAATPIEPPGRTCIYPLTACVDPTP